MVAELGNTKAGEEVTLADTTETRGGAERKCSRPTLTPTKRYGGISVAIRAAVKEVGRADLE